MAAAVHLLQLQNSETIMAYCTVGSTFVVTVEKYSMPHKSQYRAQFKSALKRYELRFGSAVTELWNRNSCSTLVCKLCTVLHKT